MSLLLLTACKQEALTLYIGTYTGKGSAGIYICDFDEKGRNWSIRDSISAVNPSYLALSQDNSLLYAVSETSASSAALQCFSLSGDSPVLKANLLSRGADPCFVCANSRLAFTANYTGGNLSVFSLEHGVPTSLVQLFPGSASGPDSLRQGEPHLHCALLSPDGAYLLASAFSFLLVSHIPPITPQQTPHTFNTAETLSGTCVIAVAIVETSGNITVFTP